MITGICKTNLDDYRTPITQFVAVPRIGEQVIAFKKGELTLLKVCNITHAFPMNGTECEYGRLSEPYIVVELML